MKQWSFIFWIVVSTLFVGAAYVLNTSTPLQTEVSASNTQGTVLGVSTVGGVVGANEQSRVTALDRIAQLRAEDMSDKSYYSHESPNGLYFFDYFQMVGLASDTPSCENLLLMPSGMTREEVNQQWQASPEHNACMTAGHTSYGYVEEAFDPDLGLSVYVYIAASL